MFFIFVLFFGGCYCSAFLDFSLNKPGDKEVKDFVVAVNKIKDPILVIGECLQQPYSLDRFPSTRFVFLDPAPNIALGFFKDKIKSTEKGCGIAGFISNLTILKDLIYFSYIIDDVGIMSGFAKYADYLDDGLTPNQRLEILSSLLSKGGIISEGGVITTNIGFVASCFTMSTDTADGNARGNSIQNTCPAFEFRMGPMRHFAKPHLDNDVGIGNFLPRLPAWKKPSFSTLREVDPVLMNISVLFNTLYHRPLKDMAYFQKEKTTKKYEQLMKVAHALNMDIGNESIHSFMTKASRIMTRRAKVSETLFDDAERRGKSEPAVQAAFARWDWAARTGMGVDGALEGLYAAMYGADYLIGIPIVECYSVIEEEMKTATYGVVFPIGEDLEEKEFNDRVLYWELNSYSVFIRKRKKGGGKKDV